MVRRIVAAAAFVAAMGPAPARAVEGVFIDPKSPAAKEYALPLESARREASATPRRSIPVDPERRSAPVFGQGPSVRTPERVRRPAKRVERQRAQRRQQRPAAPRPVARFATVPAADPTDGGRSRILVLGAALALVVLGGLLGRLVRSWTARR